MVVKELELDINFLKLETEIFNLLSLNKDLNQLCLQGKTKHYSNFSIGTGVPTEPEKNYKFIHESLYDSEIEKIILHFKAFRTRIMKMESRRCYSIHKDYSKRIHIPIKTDNQAWMIWPYENYCANLEKRKIYLTDTTKLHTFLNGSVEDRIHLVMCV